MTLQRSGSGYRWGDSGKIYTGAGARNKALEEGRAIEQSKHTSKSTRMRDLLEAVEKVIEEK